jgi:hypothetical protein
MKFKQDDVVQTRVCKLASDGEHVVGANCFGKVTVVGVDLNDGSTNGIEVLFEEKFYAHYKPEELDIADSLHESKTITEDNIAEIAEWCGGKVAPDLSRIYLETGFSKVPGYKATAGVGDRIEKLPDGKWQIWIGGHHDYDETPAVDQEDRPYMKKERKFDPLMDARELVHRIYYGPQSTFPLPIEDVYIVWFVNVLQNWKALVSTNAKDNRYYEVTFDGDKKRTYVDEYGRKSNVVFHNETGIYDMMLVQEYPL